MNYNRVISFAILGAFVGLILGAIVGIFGPPLFWQLTKPEIFQDGQWALYIFASVPHFSKVGVFLGVFVGALLGLKAKKV